MNEEKDILTDVNVVNGKELDASEMLYRLENTRIKHEIVRKEKNIEYLKTERVRCAIVAAAAFVAACVSNYYQGQFDPSFHKSVVEAEQNAIISWSSLVEYIKLLGPTMTISVTLFMASIYRNLANRFKIQREQNEIMNLEEELSISENVKTK